MDSDSDQSFDAVSVCKAAIEQGDVERLRALLATHPHVANTRIRWWLNQENESDPLHYVSACVFNKLLRNGSEATIATLLLESGAAINGSEGTETPLIGAASLSAVNVARVLIEAGADTDAVSIFGADALHWAAYVGTPEIVELLLQKDTDTERRCEEFQATPLFWAVQGLSKYGPAIKADQLGAAAALIRAGADVNTENVDGDTALTRSRDSASDEMTTLLLRSGAR